MKSIRVFLVLAVAAMLILVMFIALLKGYTASTQKAEQLFDGELQHLAALIAIANQDQMARTPIPVSKQDKSVFFQIWTDEGEIITASGNAPTDYKATLTAGYSDANFSHYRWRVLTHRDEDLSRWIVVGERHDIRLAFAETMVLESMLPMIFGILLSTFLIWFLVGRGLMPIHKLATGLSEKQPSDLSPISMTEAPVELMPLVTSANALFDRLAAAFHRERQFSANAAHELRTPISALKLHAENIRERLPEDDHEARLLVEGTDRMSYVIEQILALHRTIPDQAASSFESLDLTQLVRTEIAEHYRQFEEKQQRIELSGKPCNMQGNDFALRTLVQNLLSNASKYTPAGGDIKVSVEMGLGGSILRVSDSGVGIPKQKHKEVFKRFYRIDNDQHGSDTVGCGLGLAIVQHIVTLHQATIELSESNFSQGLAVTISFPDLTPFLEGEKNET